MENQHDQFVAAEEAILRHLQDAVDAQKKRLAAIKNIPAPVNVIIGNASMVLPAMTLEANGTVLTIGQPQAGQTEEAKPPRNAKGAVKTAILTAVKDGADNTAAIVESVKAGGIELSAGRVRTQLWNYKRDDLVKSPREGQFNLSVEGLNFLKSLGQ